VRKAALGVSIIASVVPFVAWDVNAFVEDAVLMPLGFGQPNGGGGFPHAGQPHREPRAPGALDAG
jgi:hypothetical protein